MRILYIYYIEESTSTYLSNRISTACSPTCYTKQSVTRVHCSSAIYFLSRRIVYRSRPRLPPIDLITRVKRHHRRLIPADFSILLLSMISPREHKYAQVDDIAMFFLTILRERKRRFIDYFSSVKFEFSV